MIMSCAARGVKKVGQHWCSRISALGPVGHCTSHFKRAVCISCRPRVDVHKGWGGGVRPMWTGGRGVKNLIFCGRHKWMTPYYNVSVCEFMLFNSFYSEHLSLCSVAFVCLCVPVCLFVHFYEAECVCAWVCMSVSVYAFICLCGTVLNCVVVVSIDIGYEVWAYKNNV